jgi:hypothetical protein
LSPTSREERRLRVLRKIFGSKREEGTANCRIMHNEELHDLNTSQID